MTESTLSVIAKQSAGGGIGIERKFFGIIAGLWIVALSFGLSDGYAADETDVIDLTNEQSEHRFVIEGCDHKTHKIIGRMTRGNKTLYSGEYAIYPFNPSKDFCNQTAIKYVVPDFVVTASGSVMMQAGLDFGGWIIKRPGKYFLSNKKTSGCYINLELLSGPAKPRLEATVEEFECGIYADTPANCPNTLIPSEIDVALIHGDFYSSRGYFVVRHKSGGPLATTLRFLNVAPASKCEIE